MVADMAFTQLEGLAFMETRTQNRRTWSRRPRDRTVSASISGVELSQNVRFKEVGSDTEQSEIASPVPRNHSFQTYASLRWLQPGARPQPDQHQHVRCISPASVASSTASIFPSSSSASKCFDFSELQQHDSVSLRTHTAPLQPIGMNSEARQEDPGAARRWIRWMHKHGLKAWVIPCAIAASTLVKWCIGLGSYSGYATPPLFGDYEAQRHWMEITINLPLRQWYTDDLQYWGLDYPPLTAYVSWLCGKVGSSINPSWFAFETSRGIESYTSKLFMRSTVIILDMLVYVPAIYVFSLVWHRKRSSRTQHAAFLVLLFQPTLLLIDFGHFQYNSVMLGLTLLSLSAFAMDLDLVGAICFVSSLCFKQMTLYYVPAVGSYLLGKCLFLGLKYGIQLFIRLAFVTLLSFLLVFFPFLPPFSPPSSFTGVILRIFPFARGIFEDKVANFWCFTNVTVLKWNRMFGGREDRLIKASAVLTAVGFLPAVACLLMGGCKLRLGHQKKYDRPNSRVLPVGIRTPTQPLLPYALLTTSMSFFLFSFQVHEKSILLPLMPLTLLLSGATPGDEVHSWGVLGNVVGVFSMWPLLKRDGLYVQPIAALILWCRLVGHNPCRFKSDSFVGLLSTAVHTSMVLLYLLEMIISPPRRYPDLYPVLNVLVSTPVFGFIWLWSIKRGIEVSWTLGGLPGSGMVKKIEKTHDGVLAAGATPVSGIRRRDCGARAVSLGL